MPHRVSGGWVSYNVGVETVRVFPHQYPRCPVSVALTQVAVVMGLKSEAAPVFFSGTAWFGSTVIVAVLSPKPLWLWV